MKPKSPRQPKPAGILSPPRRKGGGALASTVNPRHDGKLAPFAKKSGHIKQKAGKETAKMKHLAAQVG